MFVSNNLKLILAKPIISRLICFILFFLVLLQWLNFIFILQKAMQSKLSEKITLQYKNKHMVEISKNLNLDLFGKYVAKQLSNVNIQDSSLDLDIIGIMFAENKSESEVMLKFPNGVEKSFKIGDIISSGAIIKHIYVDKVTVNRNGVLENLKLSKNKLIFDKPLQRLK